MLNGRFERNDAWIFSMIKIRSEKRQGLIDCLALPLINSPPEIGWFTAYLIRSDPVALE
jgi:hypothetical protein